MELNIKYSYTFKTYLVMYPAIAVSLSMRGDSDAYACWAALPPRTRQRLSELTATHASFFAGPNDKDTISIHPCARTHPETGGTVLWVSPPSVGGFTTEIHAKDGEEGLELMRQCEKVIGRPEYTWGFRWETGSVAMW